MPIEQAELYATYSSDAATYGIASSNWNTEYILLANQAVELADRIPDDISAPEYYAIAQALFNQGIMDHIPDLVEAELKVSTDAQSETALLHTKASHEFLRSDIDQGRNTYGLALDAVEKYSIHPNLVASYHAHTKMLWATSEYASGYCDESKKISAAASIDISNIFPSPYQNSLKSQLVAAQNYRNENTQLCQS